MATTLLIQESETVPVLGVEGRSGVVALWPAAVVALKARDSFEQREWLLAEGNLRAGAFAPALTAMPQPARELYPKYRGKVVIEIQLRRYNGQLNAKVLAALERKLGAMSQREPVYLDFEGARSLNRRAVESLASMADRIGSSKIRFIGISHALWSEFRDIWERLGPVAVPPLWIEGGKLGA